MELAALRRSKKTYFRTSFPFRSLLLVQKAPALQQRGAGTRTSPITTRKRTSSISIRDRADRCGSSWPVTMGSLTVSADGKIKPEIVYIKIM
jgi:hypothetical protein